MTRLLQDSLGGNTKTVMIANCGPADYNLDETLSTLRYAARAKQIKNKPRVNEDPKDAMLREFQDEIARLRARLTEEQERTRSLGGGGGGGGGSSSMSLLSPSAAWPSSGGNDDEVRALRQSAAAAAAAQAAALARASQTEDERRRLEAEVADRADAHARASAEAEALAAQLTAMQEQLVVGGRVLEDKAARQEEQLRHAHVELGERRRQEEALARELEEANLMIEEQYATMADEVAAKTRKLRRVWSKLQATTAELRDRTAEFQREREELLDALRELGKQLKLKQLVIDGFVPPAELERVRGGRQRNDAACTNALPPPPSPRRPMPLPSADREPRHLG